MMQFHFANGKPAATSFQPRQSGGSNASSNVEGLYPAYLKLILLFIVYNSYSQQCLPQATLCQRIHRSWERGEVLKFNICRWPRGTNGGSRPPTTKKFIA